MVPATIQKKDNPAEKTTTRPTYRQPNYKKHFDQREGQNEHKQRSYDFRRERTKNEQAKQKTRSSIHQSNQQTIPMKIDLHIPLVDLPTDLSYYGNHCLDRGIPSNRRKGLVIVNSLCLLELARHKTRRVLFNASMCRMFDLVEPLPLWS